MSEPPRSQFIGGQIVLALLIDGRSTSAIIRRILDAYADEPELRPQLPAR